MTEVPQVVPQKVMPIPPELLSWMHLTGVTLSASDNPVLQGWAKHLLEDWRSLELLAEKYR